MKQTRQTYGNDKLIIAARSDIGKKRKGKVYNQLTKAFDIDTWIGQVNPRTGELWCEDVPDWVPDENGKTQKVLGKWIESDLVKII